MNEPTFTMGNQPGMGSLDGAPAKGGGDLIKDTSTQTFAADVIEESRRQPVLVDFWAPWCGPCKQLGPVLEKVVTGAKGAVRLVKMNIDDHPQIPGQLGIQSIPAVIAFKDGQPVDGFMGAVPESQIKEFIERIAGPVGPSDGEALVAQGDALREAGDVESAARAYADAIKIEPDNLAGIAGLAHCYVSIGELERAREVLALAPEAAAGDAAIASARAAIDLAEQSSQLGDLAELALTVERNPADHRARFDLALALNGRGKREEAVDELVEIVRRDRNWNDEGARKQLLQFFDAWGPTDEMTLYGRRRLSSVLFS